MMLRCKKMVYLRGIFYLSPFFAIKIINIITNIQSDNRLSASLYVYVFQIGYRHSDLAVIGSKLQVLDSLTDWNFKFKFSVNKTSVVKFSDSSVPVAIPNLKLGVNQLQYTDRNCQVPRTYKS